MNNLIITAAVIGLLGLIFGYVALRRLRRGRLISATRHTLACCTLLAVAAVAGMLLLNLATYHRLTHEQEVVSIEFEQLGPQRFVARLSYPHDETSYEYGLQGDEWQLDGRIIKWKGVINLLGLNTHYRLERISGRYRDVSAERSQPRTVHALSEHPGLDVWKLARKHSRWLPWVDAYFGSAAYLPMQGGARYRVSVSQTGLIARPANQIARDSLGEWR